ncbi:MAG: GNAT family N-acetyltransferase [Acidimicrobiales bacterium]
MATRISVIEWGRERARAGPWRGDPRTAYLSPVPAGPPPSPDFLIECLRTLSRGGYTSVVTGALVPAEQQPFRLVGFEEHEHLHLLARDLHDLAGARAAVRAGDPDPSVRLRRARRSDRPRALAIDAAAFRPFWRLDEAGLDEAIAATPSSRFRVALDRSVADEAVVGYAVCGRAGRHGYLQRLAVHPDAQRGGLGRALVIDGLEWMRRRGVARAVVNTQLDNEAALVLYERLGFRRQPHGLAVLRRDLAN